MKILIIGGKGFVGGYLSSHLKGNHELKITSRSLTNADFVYDVKNDNLLDVINGKFDIVINNIAPDSLSEILIEKSVKAVVNYCRENSTHLIQVSTILATSENRNLNDYNSKKALSEDIILSEMDETEFTILRFPQLFDYEGKARATQGGLYYLVEMLIKNKPIGLFSNHNECYRNYMPIELLLQIFDFVIGEGVKGLHDAYFNDFTFSLKDLISVLSNSVPDNKVKPVFSKVDSKGFSFKIDSSVSIFDGAFERESINFYLTKFINTMKG